jgi:hypothetical protein
MNREQFKMRTKQLAVRVIRLVQVGWAAFAGGDISRSQLSCCLSR